MPKEKSDPACRGGKFIHNGNAENSAGEKWMLRRQFPRLALSRGGLGSSWSALRSDAFVDEGHECRRRNQVRRAKIDNGHERQFEGV